MRLDQQSLEGMWLMAPSRLAHEVATPVSFMAQR